MEKVKERDGFSLMEMIIVIAILGMITGGIAVTYNMVRSADVKGMAYDIDSSLTNLKSKNMGSNKQLFCICINSQEIILLIIPKRKVTPRQGKESRLANPAFPSNMMEKN